MSAMQLRLIRLGPDHGMKSFSAGANIGITTKEIDAAGSKTEQGSHPGIVIVSFGKMAVFTILRRPHSAGGVGKVRVKSLAAVTLGGDRLLLRIDPFPVLIL